MILVGIGCAGALVVGITIIKLPLVWAIMAAIAFAMNAGGLALAIKRQRLSYLSCAGTFAGVLTACSSGSTPAIVAAIVGWLAFGFGGLELPKRVSAPPPSEPSSARPRALDR